MKHRNIFTNSLPRKGMETVGADVGADETLALQTHCPARGWKPDVRHRKISDPDVQLYKLIAPQGDGNITGSRSALIGK